MQTDVSLRPLRTTDADAMQAVLADPALYVHTGGTPPTLDQLRSRYERQVAGRSPDGNELWLNWIVLVAGAPAGYVQATLPVDDDTAEIAWVVGTEWQGHGYATAAARLMVDELTQRGVRHLTTRIHPDNVASQVVAARLDLRATDTVVDGETRWIRDVGPA